MSFAVFPDRAPDPTPAQPATQFSKVELFVQTRIKELIDEGWSWGAIAGALGITVEQAQWYAGYR